MSLATDSTILLVSCLGYPCTSPPVASVEPISSKTLLSSFNTTPLNSSHHQQVGWSDKSQQRCTDPADTAAFASTALCILAFSFPIDGGLGAPFAQSLHRLSVCLLNNNRPRAVARYHKRLYPLLSL